MSFFSRFFGNEISDLPASWKRDPSDGFWYGAVGRGTAAQVDVTVERARQVPVVRDCLQVLSQSVAGLSFGTFRWVEQNNRIRLDDHPLMKLFQDPNPRTTTYDFFANLTDDLCAYGYFLGRLTFAGRYVSQIDRIDPAHVQAIEMLPDGTLRFKGRDEANRPFTLLESEVWYVPVPPYLDNYVGRSAIMHDGREAIGAMIGLHDYANAFWGNDATPPFIFQYDKSFASKEDKANFLSAWTRWITGRNRGKPGVLEYGMNIKELGQSNEANQFLETRKELQLDIARLWRVPPHKIGILDRATFSNIEQQSLEFVVDTLVPWLRLIERSIAKFLIPDEGVYFQFNTASLLRGDTKARFESYQKARQWGWLSVNEIRALENMNGIGPDGDRYMEPLNMVEVGDDRDEEARDQEARQMRVLHQSVRSHRFIRHSTVKRLEEAVNQEQRGKPLLRVVGEN